ncbi:MAG: hypothetical protein QOH31_371 [Verrucomicrobiota bacterium]
MATAVLGRAGRAAPFDFEVPSKPEAFEGSDVVPVEQAITVSYQIMSDRQVAATEDNRGKRRQVTIPWKKSHPDSI